jgi:hypothetical protein
MANQKAHPGSEVERDAARDDQGPKQHGREWGEAVDDTKRPPPSDEGLQRDTKVTREKYAPPKPDEN